MNFIHRLLKFQSKDDIRHIFSLDFDVSYFIKIIEILSFLYKNLLSIEKDPNEYIYMLNFLHCIFYNL